MKLFGFMNKYNFFVIGKKTLQYLLLVNASIIRDFALGDYQETYTDNSFDVIFKNKHLLC